MDPSALYRFLASKVMTRMWSVSALEKRRRRAEKKRRQRGAPHRIIYFHQLDDGYSHLAAQLLRPLLERYDVGLEVHLVTADSGENLPEPDLLLKLSRYDAGKVAPHYGLGFPGATAPPSAEQVELAGRVVAAVATEEMPEVMVAVGNALWSGESEVLDNLARTHGSVEASELAARVSVGNAARREAGHYSGAMFFYAGEWYWGSDRMDHLEQRLTGLGARRPGATEEGLCPRPEIEFGPLQDDGQLTLEIYPSLRSPYTSLIFDHAVRLARETGVKMVMRPVLPMVMRGVPATRQKGFYIFSDAAREARSLGLKWGTIYDPIGDPIRQVYSLYPWARKCGRGVELLSSFLHAAFFDGVNTNNMQGLKAVVENAGLPWAEAREILGDSDWEAEFEANRLAMYDFGSWGVPSFRLLDEEGNEVLGLWGQDRLWLFSREIQRLLRQRGVGADGARPGAGESIKGGRLELPRA
jgi:2-hydroxychromene-2-carboxylate isomerase